MLYKEDGDETCPVEKINYLYMSDGRSSQGQPFTVASVSGKPIISSEFEAFDTRLFSDEKIIEPFIKINTEWETVLFNGNIQAGVKNTSSAKEGVSAIIINTGNIDMKKTRRINPQKRKNIYEIVFKDGISVRLHGTDLRKPLQCLFPQLKDTQCSNKYYLYVGKKAFHCIEIDFITWENAAYKDGTPYKKIRVALKNGKNVHSYSKRFEGFRIQKWIKGMGISPRMFCEEGPCKWRNRHRADIRVPGQERRGK